MRSAAVISRRTLRVASSGTPAQRSPDSSRASKSANFIARLTISPSRAASGRHPFLLLPGCRKSEIRTLRWQDGGGDTLKSDRRQNWTAASLPGCAGTRHPGAAAAIGERPRPPPARRGSPSGLSRITGRPEVWRTRKPELRMCLFTLTKLRSVGAKYRFAVGLASAIPYNLPRHLREGTSRHETRPRAPLPATAGRYPARRPRSRCCYYRRGSHFWSRPSTRC